MKALDLYSGIGCYTLAMQKAGITVVGAAERDEWRADVYEHHFTAGVSFLATDVDEAVMTVDADLWTACAGVAELGRLVGTHRDHLPRVLLLESVREPFGEIHGLLLDKAYQFAQWDACGRRFLLAFANGPVEYAVDDEFRFMGLQHPDKALRTGQTWADQEDALGLPRGYTGVCHATDKHRHGAIASASHIGHLTSVLAYVKAAG